MSKGSPEAVPGEPFDGRHEEAVAAFDRALGLDPGHFRAWFCKGYVLYKLSHSGLARERALASTGAVPDFLGEACACLRRALGLRPDYAQARQLLDEIG
jgi:tetratricopeptide (TPR) repeat protein